MRRYAVCCLWALAACPATPETEYQEGCTSDANCAADAVCYTPEGSATALCIPVYQLYCSALAQSCTGEDQVFTDQGSCLSAYNSYPQKGARGDLNGNSRYCRLTHALAAAEDTSRCADAAPNSPACGDPCDIYCSIVSQVCVNEEAHYINRAGCLAACDDMPTSGDVFDQSGDSVDCRANQAFAAYLGQTETETACLNAGPNGNGTCGALCEVYCRLAGQHCDGDDALYASPEACEAACAGLPTDGGAMSLRGNTVQCRINQLLLAESAPATYCQKAAVASGSCQ